MRLPDFLLIGAAKSGTTALFHYLGQHPDVFACPSREPNFFALEGKTLNYTGPGDMETVGLNSITNLKAYAQLFEKATPQQLAGEVSPLYLYAPDTPERIFARIPNVKLIVILRHPVDRAYASYLHLKRDARESSDTFGDALSKEEERINCDWEHLWHYYEMGRYATQLKRYFSLFNRSQIKLLLYEDFQRKPEELLSDCFEFLGVHAHFVPNLTRRPNRSGIPRSKVLQKAMLGDGVIKRAVVNYIPEKIKGKIVSHLQQLNLSRPEIDTSLRKILLARYHQEILTLQDLIKRDLSHWLAD